jgi:serine protease AprX
VKTNTLAKYFGTFVCIGAVIPAAVFAQRPVPLEPVTSAVHATHQTAPDAKMSKDAKDALAADPMQTVPVIVRFNHNKQAKWDVSLSAANGMVYRHFIHTQAVAAAMPASALKRLAQDPSVAYISIDRPLGAKQKAKSIATSAEYTTQPINAPAVWAQGYDGTGVGVAVIDSGIANLPDLGPKAGAKQRLVYSASFPSNLAGGAQDAYGHGTHVAGLIAGNGNHSTGNQFTRTFTGVAPNANLINLRVLDQNGQGYDSTVIEAIEAAIALKTTFNIRVINLSLGRPIWESYQQDPLCQAVEAAWKAGIVVVVAAGNEGRNENLNPEGYGTIEAPGNDPYVITVGAMNTMNTIALSDDIIASYSSKGPSFIDQIAKPDVVAPGNLVTSLLKGGSTIQKENPTFFTPHSFYVKNSNFDASPDYTPLSGTSMATGVVSGAVAVLLQAQPQLTPDAVKALLMFSAQRSYFPSISTAVDPVSGDRYFSHYDALTVGAGYVDLQATLANALNIAASIPTGTAMSPVVSYNSSTGDATLVTDQTALWGRTDLWGAANVYGQNAFEPGISGSTALWGRTALWGADDPSGFTALWGATALWGRATPDAATALWGASIISGQSSLHSVSITDAN